MARKIEHAARAHATLSPSKGDMWFNCTASIGLIKELKPVDTRSPAGDEGTAAHELLEASIKAEKPPIHKDWLGKVFNKVWKVTREMAEAVQVCYDLQLSLSLEGWTIYSEQKNPIACTGEGGTVDIAAHKGRKLKIIDYKHGRGVIVSPERSIQMRLYALGMIDRLKLRGKVDEIELIIVQPRAQHEPARWMDNYEDLLAFEEEVCAKRINIQTGNTGFFPSEKTCRWCPVKGQCKAFASQALSAASLDFADVTTKVKPVVKKETTKKIVGMIQPHEANAIAHNLDYIEAWIKAIRGHIFDLAASAKLPDFKVVQGDANRRWKDPEVVTKALAKLGFDEDTYCPRSLAGLGVVEDLFSDKAKREAFMKKFTTRPEGKPALVTKDDPRPAINPADDFVGITQKDSHGF